MENWKKQLTNRVIELNSMRRGGSPFIERSTRFEYLTIRGILEYAETHTKKECIEKLKERMINANCFEKDKIQSIVIDIKNSKKPLVEDLKDLNKLSQSRRYI